MGPLDLNIPADLRRCLPPAGLEPATLSVNSRMLCQLSYRGPLHSARSRAAGREKTSSVRAASSRQYARRPARTHSTCEAGWTATNRSSGRGPVIRYLVVLAVGYVLGREGRPAPI